MSYKNRFSADAISNHGNTDSSPETSSKKIPLEQKQTETMQLTPEKAEQKEATEKSKEEGPPPVLDLCDDYKQINLFTTMGKQKSGLIFKLWEIMMLNESLLILADSPIICR